MKLRGRVNLSLSLPFSAHCSEKNIVWIAAEGVDGKLMRKAKRGYKKHLLLVGLNSEIRLDERD